MPASLNSASSDILWETGAATGRRKLWQLDSACREALVGICLSSRERKLLCHKLTIAVHSPEADELRRALVNVSGTPTSAARRLHKYLDRKYWRTILRFTGATSTAALAALWGETRTGEVPNAYWALITHPHACAWLIAQVHREAHDRVPPGAQPTPIDDQTLGRLQQTNAALAGTPVAAKPGITMQLSVVEGLSGLSARTTTQDPDPTRPQAMMQDMECLLLNLRSQVEDYAAKLALERVRAERAEASAREWKQRAILDEKRRPPRAAATVAPARGTRKLHRQPETRAPGRQRHMSGTG